LAHHHHIYTHVPHENKYSNLEKNKTNIDFTKILFLPFHMKDVQEIFHEKMYKYIDQYLIFEQNKDLEQKSNFKIEKFFFFFYLLFNQFESCCCVRNCFPWLKLLCINGSLTPNIGSLLVAEYNSPKIIYLNLIFISFKIFTSINKIIYWWILTIIWRFSISGNEIFIWNNHWKWIWSTPYTNWMIGICSTS